MAGRGVLPTQAEARTLSAWTAIAAGAPGGREAEIAAFERFADLAVKLPPVIRQSGYGQQDQQEVTARTPL